MHLVAHNRISFLHLLKIELRLTRKGFIILICSPNLLILPFDGLEEVARNDELLTGLHGSNADALIEADPVNFFALLAFKPENTAILGAVVGENEFELAFGLFLDLEEGASSYIFDSKAGFEVGDLVFEWLLELDFPVVVKVFTRFAGGVECDFVHQVGHEIAS